LDGETVTIGFLYPFGCEYRTLGIVVGCLSLAKRRKIMLSDEQFRTAVHRFNVQCMCLPPKGFGSEGVFRCLDVVFVFAQSGIESGVEIIVARLH